MLNCDALTHTNKGFFSNAIPRYRFVCMSDDDSAKLQLQTQLQIDDNINAVYKSQNDREKVV